MQQLTTAGQQLNDSWTTAGQQLSTAGQQLDNSWTTAGQQLYNSYSSFTVQLHN